MGRGVVPEAAARDPLPLPQPPEGVPPTRYSRGLIAFPSHHLIPEPLAPSPVTVKGVWCGKG